MSGDEGDRVDTDEFPPRQEASCEPYAAIRTRLTEDLGPEAG